MKFKKILALTLAATMTMGISMTALADEVATPDLTTADVTITNAASAKEAHTYDVYQVFKGTLSLNEEGKYVLADIEWGSAITSGVGEYADAQDYAKYLATKTGKGEAEAEAINIAAAIKTAGTEPVKTVTTEKGATSVSIDELAPGYYFITDQNSELKEDGYSAYILEVCGVDVDVKAKADSNTLTKKLTDINDSKDTTYTGLQDGADYDIGDVIEFTIETTVTSKLADYTEYEYIIHDVESAGLTFDASSVVVKVGDTTISGYTVVTETSDDCTFEIDFGDLAKQTEIKAGDKLTVTYSATLNENAVLGSLGNPNEAYLTFSNNPYDTEGKGETPKDKVIVFTYKAEVDKVYENAANEKLPLGGAEFTVEKYDLATDSWVELTVIKTTSEGLTDPDIFTVKGIDDGYYRITETKAPAGYNALKDPIYFTVVGDHDITSDDPALNELKVFQNDGTAMETALETGAIATFEIAADYSGATTKIVNKSGSVLPSTGGIGTTIFYVIGGLVIIGACVLLIVRKKVDTEEV